MFVILGWNSNNNVALAGTATGKPFASEDAARKMARRLEEAHPTVSYLVLAIEPADI